MAKKLVMACAEKGLLAGLVGMYGNVLRVSPPLVTTIEQADEAFDILEKAIASL